MTKRILCIGELLIDFFAVEKDISIQQAVQFEKQAGGAPANVCAAIAKLGGQASFCGKVGDDAFGHFLEATLQDAHVNTQLLLKDPHYTTTLAFVSRQADGERDFIFNRGADAQLRAEELPVDLLFSHDIVHFGSATALLSEPFATTYRHLFIQFEQEGALLAFDPNYREDLWKGQEGAFVQACMPFLRTAHFVKMSEEELALFSSAGTVEERIKELYAHGMKWLVITLGARGTLLYDGELTRIPSVKVQSVDSTGAGDAFVGAMLMQFSMVTEPFKLERQALYEMIKRANQVGAKVCEKVGAMTALPTWEDL